MPSLLNQVIFNETKKAFEEATSTVMVAFDGFDQGDSIAIREMVRAAGGQSRLIKNSVSTLVFKDLGYEGAEQLLEGSILALMGDDPVAMSKVAEKFFKTTKKGESTGGIVDGQVISREDVKALSKLPSREVLLSQTLSVISAPLRGMATVLSANLRNIATVLDAIREQKEKEAA